MGYRRVIYVIIFLSVCCSMYIEGLSKSTTGITEINNYRSPEYVRDGVTNLWL